jgi:hypothetical protein
MDDDSCTTFHRACYSDKTESLSFLLSASCNADAKDEHGLTRRQVTVAEGNCNIIKLMQMEKYSGHQITSPNHSGNESTTKSRATISGRECRCGGILDSSKDPKFKACGRCCQLHYCCSKQCRKLDCIHFHKSECVIYSPKPQPQPESEPQPEPELEPGPGPDKHSCIICIVQLGPNEKFDETDIRTGRCKPRVLRASTDWSLCSGLRPRTRGSTGGRIRGPRTKTSYASWFLGKPALQSS